MLKQILIETCILTLNLLPTTPQKRRHATEDEDIEEEEEIQPSQKEAKIGEKDVMDEKGGGETGTCNVKCLDMGGEGEPMKEEKGETLPLKEDYLKEDTVGKEDLSFPRDTG